MNLHITQSAQGRITLTTLTQRQEPRALEGRQPRWTHRENFMFSFSCRVLKYEFDQNEDVSKLIRRNIIMITLDLSQ